MLVFFHSGDEIQETRSKVHLIVQHFVFNSGQPEAVFQCQLFSVKWIPDAYPLLNRSNGLAQWAGWRVNLRSRGPTQNIFVGHHPHRATYSLARMKH